MHHATAVRRLRTIAESCQHLMGWPVDEPILHSAYAFGAVLEGTDDLEFVQVAFVLNLPTDELTWGARPRSYSWLSYQLRLEKTPVDSYWRAEHKGDGIYPEHHLWDATHGYLDLLDAVAVLSQASDDDEPRRPRPRIGGYRSTRPLSAEEIDAELASGFGDRR